MSAEEDYDDGEEIEGLLIDAVIQASETTLHEYDLWAADANDGEFAIWSSERFMASFMHLRTALNAWKTR